MSKNKKYSLENSAAESLTEEEKTAQKMASEGEEIARALAMSSHHVPKGQIVWETMCFCYNPWR